jgi:tetratricopeptide (TPR) repeat protein
MREHQQGGGIIHEEERHDFRFYLVKEPVILTLLLALTAVFFLLVTVLSHRMHNQQALLAQRWYARGNAELSQQHFAAAVGDFRAALLYAADDYSYQLKLAEALAGEGHLDEAHAYLLNLWDREPENGLVNLELARIAVQSGDREHALRYFHNAIYATWNEKQPGEPTASGDAARRDARLELIEYLLSIHATPQAQSELIALTANLEEDPSQHLRVAELFLKADDYEHALAEFRQSLELNPAQAEAWAGAGQAAYELRRYGVAREYLEGAVARNPGDEQSASLLKTTELVLQMDPFGRKIPVNRRDRIVLDDFAAAGERLKSCSAQPASQGAAAAASWQTGLMGEWEKMNPQMTESGLHRNPELVDEAMDLVFEIERQSSVHCGAPAGADLALLQIAKLHEGK